MSEELDLLIEKKIQDYKALEKDIIFVSSMKETYKDNLLAVILYGSSLYSNDPRRSGIMDYFVITDDYKSLPISVLAKVCARLVPPLQYSVSLKGNPKEPVPYAKYHVLSLKDLIHNTGSYAPDSYVLGRFSKRTALLYSSSPQVLKNIVKSIKSASEQVVKMAISFIDKNMDMEQRILQCLYFSYRNEIRMENFSKVKSIFDYDPEYYRKIFGYFIERINLLLSTGNSSNIDKNQVLNFIKKSRIRAILRWPVMMLTVDRWVDILLLKLEKTHGEKLELTPRQRKYALFTALKHFIRLRKQGKVN